MSTHNQAALMVNGIITIHDGGRVVTVPKTHAYYNEILEHVKAMNYHEAVKLASVREAVKEYGEGHVEVRGNTVFYKGEELHNALTSRIVAMMRDGFNITPMVNFLENMMANPSYQSRQELILFLEGNSLPLTEDGHFLAYKSVRDNYKDSYSGKIDNSVGQTVTMDRSEVDDNRNNTCSAGLHFASLDYATGFSGGRLMILKINPRDVVSIPHDYDNQKGRCCRYQVVDEFKKYVGEYTDKAVVKTPKVSSGDTRLNHLNQKRDRYGRFC